MSAVVFVCFVVSLCFVVFACFILFVLLLYFCVACCSFFVYCFVKTTHIYQYIPEYVSAHQAISVCSLSCNDITSYQYASYTSVQVSAIIHQYEHTCVHISTHPDMSACSSNCNRKMVAGNRCSLTANCKLQLAVCSLGRPRR